MNRNVLNQISINEAINGLLKKHAPRHSVIMDVGCWNGSSTLTYVKTLHSKKVYGIECIERPAASAKSKGIDVIFADIEKESLNLPEASIDVVVCNQVFEHLKDIFNAFDQITKSLKPNGILIISVPNLASFHNRCMLALGMQPSSVRLWGPHVRGFVLKEFTSFLLTKNLYNLITIKGVGFYPFSPKTGGNILAGLWKNASHTAIWVLKRSSLPMVSYKKSYVSQGQQTLM